MLEGGLWEARLAAMLFCHPPLEKIAARRASHIHIHIHSHIHSHSYSHIHSHKRPSNSIKPRSQAPRLA